MTAPVPVIDLFSGPGGLAEGFAALQDPPGRYCFNVALSIEMEPTACRTLLLRGFLRKFPSGYPPEYFDFLNGVLAEEPDWASLYPVEWEEASDETHCLTLGTPEASSFVRQRLAEIRAVHGDRTVLLGGPPCQSYSVVGRARNVGNADYDPCPETFRIAPVTGGTARFTVGTGVGDKFDLSLGSECLVLRLRVLIDGRVKDGMQEPLAKLSWPAARPPRRMKM